MILLELYFAFLKISFFAIGGAYSLFPILEKVLVEENNWISSEEFLELVAASEIMPGAISIKFATYIGLKKAGIIGVLISNLGNLSIPASLMGLYYFLETETKFILKYKQIIDMMKFSVLGIFSAILIQYIQKQYKIPWQILPFVASFLLVYFFKINPFWLILGTGFASLGVFYYAKG